jgi:cytochrome c oxidase subunit 3
MANCRSTPPRVVADVSDLPDYSFSHRSLMWWGTICFIAIETSGFGLAVATYLFLVQQAQSWPPAGDALPVLLPGSLMTALLLISLFPNYLTLGWARSEDICKTRLGLVIISVLGLTSLVLRVFEFRALNVYWDTDAYGAVLWSLLGLHTLHLATDVIDTIVLTCLMFTPYGLQGRRFSDVEDNSVYWDFVVASWLPIYVVLYWVPRWL